MLNSASTSDLHVCLWYLSVTKLSPNGPVTLDHLVTSELDAEFYNFTVSMNIQDKNFN